MRYKGTSSFQPLLLTWDTLIQSSLVIHGGLGPWGIDPSLMLSICMWSIFVYGYGRMCLCLTSFSWIQHCAWCVANSNFAYWNFLGFFFLHIFLICHWLNPQMRNLQIWRANYWLIGSFIFIDWEREIEKSGDLFMTLGLCSGGLGGVGCLLVEHHSFFLVAQEVLTLQVAAITSLGGTCSRESCARCCCGGLGVLVAGGPHRGGGGLLLAGSSLH